MSQRVTVVWCEWFCLSVHEYLRVCMYGFHTSTGNVFQRNISRNEKLCIHLDGFACSFSSFVEENFLVLCQEFCYFFCFFIFSFFFSVSQFCIYTFNFCKIRTPQGKHKAKNNDKVKTHHLIICCVRAQMRKIRFTRTHTKTKKTTKKFVLR